MFKKIRGNRVESDEGFSVETLGRGGIKYKEGSKAFYVDSEMTVDRAIVIGTEFLGGSYGWLVYKNRIKNWESPIGSFEPIDADKRDKIVENIRKALLFLGYRIEIEDSY